jgi:hypothetical protein
MAFDTTESFPKTQTTFLISASLRGGFSLTNLKQNYMQTFTINKEDLKDIASTAVEITSEAITKTATAIKTGLDDKMFCKHCGEKIDSDSKFCNKCGKEQ